MIVLDTVHTSCTLLIYMCNVYGDRTTQCAIPDSMAFYFANVLKIILLDLYFHRHEPTHISSNLMYSAMFSIYATLEKNHRK